MSAVKRPPELDDAEWLANALQTRGEVSIAAQLGCGRTAVRRARERHGIPPARPGRRQALPREASSGVDVVATFLAQVRHDRAQRHPASYHELLRHLAAGIEASKHSDHEAARDAAIMAAAASIRIAIEFDEPRL